MLRSSIVGKAIFAIFLTFSFTCAQDYGYDQSVKKDEGVQSSSDTRLIFNGEGMVVNPSERLFLDCGVEGKYRSCIWEKGGEQPQTFQVEDIHEGFEKGMSRPDSTKGNECGIVIDSVTPNDNGLWTCKVFVVGNALTGSKSIVVTIKPQPPTLSVSDGSLLVAENEEREIECVVAAARPAARIRWQIGNEDFTARSHTEATPTDDMGTYRSVSVLKHRFVHDDDRKSLKCVIEHETLVEPEFSEVPLDVRYKPYPVSSPEIYGIPEDSSEYEIKFNFTSNPRPEMKWSVAGDEIQVPSERGRYSANYIPIADNTYMATLKIQDFSPADVNMVYKLITTNELGETPFDITLSTRTAPDGGYDTSEIITPPEKIDSEESIGSGGLAAIIIIVLLILVILIIIGLMRYRRMFCFGPKDKIKNHMKDSEANLKEEHSDTESALPEATTDTKTSKVSLFKNINIRSMIPKRGQKEQKPENIEEGVIREEPVEEEKGKTNPEVVYAELELGKRENSDTMKKENQESTEYAEIVGTLPDNNDRERVIGHH